MSASNTSTANTAPTGSITIPSHLRAGPLAPMGRIWCSMGTTTVGPDTTSTAPSNTAIGQSMPNSQWAANKERPQVTNIPTVTRRVTMPPTARNYLTERLKPPSNRINATASDTTG